MYLNTHTFFSLRYGTFSVAKLIDLAKENGVQSFALTDINNTSAATNFVRLAKKSGIKPVVGVDFRVGVDQKFIALAKNNNGFQRINTYLSQLLHENQQPSEEAPLLEDTYIIYPWGKEPNRKLKENEYIGVTPQQLNRLRVVKVDSKKMVILQTVSFRNKRDFNAHRLLRAINNNTLLSKLPLSEQAYEFHKMLPISEIQECYAEVPDLIENTLKLLNSCFIDFKFDNEVELQNQETYTGSKEEDLELMRKLCEEGLPYRYKAVTKEIRERIEKEIDAINKKSYVAYFLINWDILRYARSKGYFYVGRGSGANSIIAYLLKITNVDPIELDLYFERFINLYRINPPDFDIDFSWRDRDDITRYIFEKFDNVALVATYNTFSTKAAIREVGKVLGLPKAEIDTLAGEQKAQRQDKLDHMSKLVLLYSSYINGFPNHLSVHASGIVISEKPLNCLTATFTPPKGYPTIQFDMVAAEDIGLYKYDILSQRGLGKIKDALEIIKYNKNEEIDIHDLPKFKEDPLIKKALKDADAIGCFYVESPAMRMLFKKLQVDSYLGVVAASSIIRPGVAKSGMMRAYIERFRNPEKRKEAHPVMYDLMPDTFGIMVYQEDVIKVGHHFGKLSLEEADMLRRGMAGKYRGREEFQKVKRQFFSNCEANNIEANVARDVWYQIESFAGYAFSKGHSASYAVESYQSMYLKMHYPLEYMVATINNFGGFYRSELYVHEARMKGAKIHPPCINNSNWETVITGNEIYLGFMLIQLIEDTTAKKIVAERNKNGSFLDLDDFIERIGIHMEQISLLVRMDVFRFTGKNKRELLWEVHFKLSKEIKKDWEINMFPSSNAKFQIPSLDITQREQDFDQIELMGFSLSDPFDLIIDRPNEVSLAKDLTQRMGEEVTVVGYYVTTKSVLTVKNEYMYFGTFLDQEGQWLDTVHFPPTAKKHPFKGRGVYLMKGKVIEEFGCISVEVNSMEKLAMIEDPRYAFKSVE